MTSPAICITDLIVRYEGAERRALDGINLTVSEGEIVGVIGPTGAGKTTLLSCVAGVIPFHEDGAATRGDVSVMGRSIADYGGLPAITEHVGLVMQDPEAQLVNTTVREELVWGMENNGVPVDEIDRRMHRAAQLFGIDTLLDRFTSGLSGGQKQRVVVAAVFCLGPKIMLLDEPTSELDPAGTEDVMRAIRVLADEGVTVVVVEHKIDELARHADRLVAMNAGRIERIGTVREVLEDPNVLERPQILEVAQRLRTAGHWPGPLPLTLDEAVASWRAMAAPIPTASHTHSPTATSAMTAGVPVIEIRNIEHRYRDGTQALAGVDLGIAAGEFVAIIGKNGSGKTTLAKHFNGLLKPTNRDGSVTVSSRDLGVADIRKTKLHQLASTIGYVFQNPDRQIFHDTCREELEYGPRNLGVADPKTLSGRVAHTLEVTGLDGMQEANPVHLSRGERQRLAIASSLVMDCAVVVIDEPTTGQDRAESRKILDSLAEHHRRGRTVVIISHDMALVAEYATRVIAMKSGKVIADGPPAEVFSQREVLHDTNIRPPQAAVLAAELGLSGVLTVDDAVEAMIVGYRPNSVCQEV
jgi:energy-coupling factor transporter ATP-binding protein EcfA2